MKRIIIMLLALLLSSAWAEEEARYDELGFYGEDAMWPVKQNGLWGFVNQNGEIIIPCEWEDVGRVVDGHAPVQKDGKWGVIDQSGSLILPCVWDSVIVDDYGGLLVIRDGFYGALALDGTVLMPCGEYTYIGAAIDGVRHVCKDDKWGMCSATGEIITECQWENPGYFHDGLAFVSDLSGTQYGYIDQQGALVIPCELRHAEDFHDGAAVVRRQDGTWQLIDTQGQSLCEEAWDDMETFSAGSLIMVEKNGKFGYMDRQGRVAIPVIYDQAQKFGDGLALVRLGEETFWINEQGEKALDRPQGYTSLPFCQGFAAMIDEAGRVGLMDKQGNFVIPCRWEEGLRFAYTTFSVSEIIRVEQEECQAFLNRKGEMVSGYMYEKGTIQYGIGSEYLFLLKDGSLSIYHADETIGY